MRLAALLVMLMALQVELVVVWVGPGSSGELESVAL